MPGQDDNNPVLSWLLGWMAAAEPGLRLLFRTTQTTLCLFTVAKD
ncbi:hypothetical protein CPCC7001_1090 [Cyanobium sp. PCC 7001]|nr:hypothetical protein CPCC7001_1090 [Cyanobium sp. PCC 7001]